MDPSADLVERLRSLGTQPLDAEADEIGRRALAAGARTQVRLARRRVAALCVVGTMAASSGLAAADMLPAPAQRAAAAVLGTVGIDVPDRARPVPVPCDPTDVPCPPSADGETTGSADVGDAPDGITPPGPARCPEPGADGVAAAPPDRCDPSLDGPPVGPPAAPPGAGAGDDRPGTTAPGLTQPTGPGTGQGGGQGGTAPGQTQPTGPGGTAPGQTRPTGPGSGQGTTPAPPPGQTQPSGSGTTPSPPPGQTQPTGPGAGGGGQGTTPGPPPGQTQPTGSAPGSGQGSTAPGQTQPTGQGEQPAPGARPPAR